MSGYEMYYCQRLRIWHVAGLNMFTYQGTPTYFTSHKPSKTAETRMHYTMC